MEWCSGDKRPTKAPTLSDTTPSVDSPKIELEIDHDHEIEVAHKESKANEQHRRIALPVAELYLEKVAEKFPHIAQQIRNMDLAPIDEDEVAYTVIKIEEQNELGHRYQDQGQCVFFIQAVTAALVPVLIGIMGSIGEGDNAKTADDILRYVSIFLSILGTIAKAFQEVFVFRQRGQMISEACSDMNDLFHRYVALAGPVFDPEKAPDKANHPLAKSGWTAKSPENAHQIMFRTYVDVFNEQMSQLRRADAMLLGSASPGESPASGGDSGGGGGGGDKKKAASEE